MEEREPETTPLEPAPRRTQRPAHPRMPPSTSLLTLSFKSQYRARALATRVGKGREREARGTQERRSPPALWPSSRALGRHRLAHALAVAARRDGRRGRDSLDKCSRCCRPQHGRHGSARRRRAARGRCFGGGGCGRGRKCSACRRRSSPLAWRTRERCRRGAPLYMHVLSAVANLHTQDGTQACA